MKRKALMTIALVTIFCVLIVSLTACGDKKAEDKKETAKNTTSETEKEKIEEKTEEDSNENNGVEAKTTVEYDYKDGVLTQIVDEEGQPKQTDFVVDGIILVGNRHGYENLEADAGGIMEKLVSQGYKKDEINSSFYLNEYIEFYIDTKYAGSANDVKILVTPHKTVEELEKMSLTELEELALDNGGFVLDYQTPDVDNYKYVGNGYVNMDYPEGKYDILFMYKGKPAYFININLEKEPVE